MRRPSKRTRLLIRLALKMQVVTNVLYTRIYYISVIVALS
jgi:hypothetical protein